LSLGKQELEAIIEERIRDEVRVTKLLRDSMRETDNVVIRLLLNQMALDSVKHESMLRATLGLLDSPSEEGFRTEGEEFLELIEKHVEIERRMLEEFERVVDRIEDSRIRFMVQNIIGDERRHHSIMKHLHGLVFEAEKIQDEKWWDFLFRYSRLKG